MKRLNYCNTCFDKQRTIDRLQVENQRLRDKLRIRDRQADGYFGSSTPSSQIPVKANSLEENQKKRGGAVHGHSGHGRAAISGDMADRVLEVDGAEKCPQCGGNLQDCGAVERTVIESQPLRGERIVYRIPKKRCTRCKKTYRAQVPGVLPKSLFGNGLLATAAGMHYLHGVPQGRVCEQLGIGDGSLFESMHRLAKLFEGVLEPLRQAYRQSPVKHADETGWRNDGHSGYAWLFCTETLSLFEFRDTRSARVPKEVLGETSLPGVLVVDRYAGYNKVPCAIQYCYAHLLREVQDLQKEFPEDKEVASFASTLGPLLAMAMGLRNQEISDTEFYSRARQTKAAIQQIAAAPAQHLGIRRIQDIFTDHEARLYHWASSRAVPADNNRSERDLRPTVIARKVSHGSQSEKGAKTRSTLATVFHTLKKRTASPVAAFRLALDQLALDPSLNPHAILFPENSS